MTPHLPAVEMPQGFGFNPYRFCRDRHHQGIATSWDEAWVEEPNFLVCAALLFQALPRQGALVLHGLARLCPAWLRLAQARYGVARHGTALTDKNQHGITRHSTGTDLTWHGPAPAPVPSPSPQLSAPAHEAGGALPGPAFRCLRPLAWWQGGCPVALAATCYPS